MQYVSTRGASAAQQFSDVLIEGLAADGGLAVPLAYPRLERGELAAWRNYDYRQLAFALISRFATDIPAPELRAIIDRTYTRAVFGSDEITPVKALGEGVYLLALSNGPTLAFKDLALQLLGNLLDYVLERRGKTLNILAATSGDTGSAAEYAMRGKARVRVFMLSPYGKVSPFQAAQMFSLQDENIFNIAVDGVFDDCQDIVKTINADAAFKKRFSIGAVNSINWARIVAQIVYYFKAYFAVTESDDEPVSIAVPSGNFGNIFAGYVARCMGLPLRKLILATNENNVLDEFFRTGIYRLRPPAEVMMTSSPSMDISKASNFERFIFDLLGRDGARVTQLWQRLSDTGFFDLSATAEFARIAETGFVSGSSSHADRIATIRRVYERYGEIIDTHTADGVKVGLAEREDGIPLVCLETAQAIKFEAAVVEALGRKPLRPEALTGLEQRPQRVTRMAPDARKVKMFIEQYGAG